MAPSRAFDRGLLRGVARYARTHGPWTFLREPPHDRQIDWKQKVSNRLRSGTVDAVIMREPERIEEIVQMGIPGICAPRDLSHWSSPRHPVSCSVRKMGITCAQDGIVDDASNR